MNPVSLHNFRRPPRNTEGVLQSSVDTLRKWLRRHMSGMLMVSSALGASDTALSDEQFCVNTVSLHILRRPPSNTVK